MALLTKNLDGVACFFAVLQDSIGGEATTFRSLAMSTARAFDIIPIKRGETVCKSAILLLATAMIMAAQPKVTPAGAGHESKNSELAFLNLESLATVLRHAVDRTGRPMPPNQPPMVSQSSQTEHKQYISLYGALTRLRRTRASYIEALQLYVTGVKKHLPLQERHNALLAQVRDLRTNLDSLTSAFDPLKLSLDYHAPEVSSLIDEYVGSRQAKAASLGIVETLTLPELEQLQAQAKQNGKTLDAGIKALLKFIKEKYPDIDKGV